MKSWFVGVETGVVAMTVLAACSSTDGIGSGHFIDVESVDGGKRLRVEGVFEVTAPIAVRTDGGIVFESTSSRRDVVFTDWLIEDPSDPRVTKVGGECSMEFHLEDLSEASALAPSNRKQAAAEEVGKTPVRPMRANHVRVRTDGHGRYVVDAIDLSDGTGSEYNTVISTHVEYDVSAR
ncbi:MAG TPA: hypothetical protein VFG37_07715 [Planctomycetota bacterium]|jgi:hypothetical protein|nr:hypothetical protein [Planctomycetota bacterium]